MTGIQVGDYVTIGDNALTWQVTRIEPEACVYGDLAKLESGQTARVRYEAVAHLTPYRRLTEESAA